MKKPQKLLLEILLATSFLNPLASKRLSEPKAKPIANHLFFLQKKESLVFKKLNSDGKNALEGKNTKPLGLGGSASSSNSSRPLHKFKLAKLTKLRKQRSALYNRLWLDLTDLNFLNHKLISPKLLSAKEIQAELSVGLVRISTQLEEVDILDIRIHKLEKRSLTSDQKLQSLRNQRSRLVGKVSENIDEAILSNSREARLLLKSSKMSIQDVLGLDQRISKREASKNT